MRSNAAFGAMGMLQATSQHCHVRSRGVASEEEGGWGEGIRGNDMQSTRTMTSIATRLEPTEHQFATTCKAAASSTSLLLQLQLHGDGPRQCFEMARHVNVDIKLASVHTLLQHAGVIGIPAMPQAEPHMQVCM